MGRHERLHAHERARGRCDLPCWHKAQPRAGPLPARSIDPVAPVCIAGEPGGWLADAPFRYELLDRWAWSGGEKPIELLASRHRDDTTTTAEQARAWVDAAFTACAACDLPRPRFVEFADAGVLFVFDLHKTHEHMDRVANLHAMIREAGGVGGLAADATR